ncbi:MAG: hypothetical protein Q8920_14835 [Bacillota bacterium]|nr:hypothetical protein [Bacillota bacterium]
MKYRELLDHIERNAANYTAKYSTSSANRSTGCNDEDSRSCCSSNQKCHAPGGTISRLYIPAGATFNYLNLIEVSSPSGVSLVVRIPFLGDSKGSAYQNIDLSDVLKMFRTAGVSVEVEK